MTGLPFPPRFAQSIGDDHELARDGRDDDFVRLAGPAEPIRESFERWVVMGGDQCSLEQDMPERAPTTGDGALAAQRFSESVGVVSAVGQKPVCRWQRVRQSVRATIVADLPGSHENP